MAKWYEESIFYHIYPLGMCGAQDTNRGQGVTHRFTQLNEWLPHIKNIGCNAIYIGPLFESSVHGYDTIDFYKVDRRLGTNDEFKEYVKLCHSMGIKVVVDGVFNHTGREFFAFQDLIKNQQNSEYKDWYCKVDFNNDNSYKDGFTYESWRGAIVLAKLNLLNSDVKEYLFNVVKFWVEEFDIDGIRLDCADVLNFQFMKELRSLTDGLKQDFWLMGEVIHGTYSRWANDKMLHSVTNYELHQAFFSSHNTHNYFELAHTAKRLFDPVDGICKNQTLYSFLDNHDVNRIVSKLDKIEYLYPATILLYTLPGIPSIYYGSEFLVKGVRIKNDIPLRPKLEFADYIEIKEGNLVYKEHGEYIELLAKLADIRKKCIELVSGEYEMLHLTNYQYAFARKLGKRAVIVIVNNDDKQVDIKIPVQSKEVVNLLTNEVVPTEKNMLCTKVNPCSGEIFLTELFV